jgi:hypothetical protein
MASIGRSVGSAGPNLLAVADSVLEGTVVLAIGCVPFAFVTTFRNKNKKDDLINEHAFRNLTYLGLLKYLMREAGGT